jgi:Icc protein
MNNFLSWVHFGDLHITEWDEPNYADFLTLIAEANAHLTGSVGFAYLPGDNADDGERDEYILVRDAITRCELPVHAITGDHDFATGRFEYFKQDLCPTLYRSFSMYAYQLIFLNSVAEWRPPQFGLGEEQMNWLENQLAMASKSALPAVFFMHAYPSQHREGEALRHLIRDHRVLMVDMGHTHYNELANDGQSIYAATRSTGQIEEGQAGFSIVALDRSVVSWKFKPIGEWPLVMITSPADHRLITDSSDTAQRVRGEIEIRARAWGSDISSVSLRVGAESDRQMVRAAEAAWSCRCDFDHMSDGLHRLSVSALTSTGRSAQDTIQIIVDRHGQYDVPERSPVDRENAVGAWPEKQILGTRLGPNENGHPWPPRQESQRCLKVPGARGHA